MDLITTIFSDPIIFIVGAIILLFIAELGESLTDEGDDWF